MKISVGALLAEKKSEVYSIHSTATVMAAVEEMNRLGIGSLLILDEGNLVGIFTERDVLRRVVVPKLPAESTRVSEVMSSDVDTFPPELSLDEAMAHMTEKRHRHVPIVQKGQILGLVSIGDITRWLSRNSENEAQNLLNYFTGTYNDQ